MVKEGINRRSWWGLATAYASAIIMGLVAMLFAADKAHEAESRAIETDRESSQKWCAVVVTLDDAYRQLPPTTATGRRLAEEIAKLRKDFGC